MREVLQGYIDSESRVDRMRRLNRVKQAQEEDLRAEELHRADMHRRDGAKARSREEAMASLIERRRQEQLCSEKKVQLVREQAPELRGLEQKLQAAYMNKERAAQLEEARVLEAARREEDRRGHEEMLRMRDTAVANQEAQDRERHAQLRQQKDVLAQQMQDREAAKLAAFQQFLEEKKIVDDVVARIYEEDHAAREEKHRKQRVTQAYIETYLKEREEYSKKMEEVRGEEDRKIVEFMQKQARRKEENLAAAKEKEAVQQRRLEEQTKAIEAERSRREEMEALIADYHLELVEKKERERAREEMERKVKARLVMLEANEYQKQLKQVKREEEADEKLHFRQRMMEKFAEDDRIDQMKLAERNRKRAEHNREVQKLVEQRQQQAEEEREREKEALRRDEEKEDERRRIIQEERVRLLREHAAKLKEYLPKGVLTEEDMRVLGITSVDQLTV